MKTHWFPLIRPAIRAFKIWLKFSFWISEVFEALRLPAALHALGVPAKWMVLRWGMKCDEISVGWKSHDFLGPPSQHPYQNPHQKKGFNKALMVVVGRAMNGDNVVFLSMVCFYFFEGASQLNPHLRPARIVWSEQFQLEMFNFLSGRNKGRILLAGARWRAQELGYLKSLHNRERFGATPRFRSAHLSIISFLQGHFNKPSSYSLYPTTTMLVNA